MLLFNAAYKARSFFFKIMSELCAKFPESTSFLVRFFKSGTIKIFTDEKEIGLKKSR